MSACGSWPRRKRVAPRTFVHTQTETSCHHEERPPHSKNLQAKEITQLWKRVTNLKTLRVSRVVGGKSCKEVGTVKRTIDLDP